MNSQHHFITKIINLDLKKNKNKILKTRFPPEPNGYLHLGHAKALCLNFGLANYYKGSCNLRFDDTNPKKIKKKYIKSIQDDIRWLGFQWSGEITYTSYYFNTLYDYAIELINKNLAYVDLLNKQQIREYRGTLTTPGKNSPYRNNSIKTNLILFEKMKIGKFKPGEACLRAKINMQSHNIVLRDPVLYRIIFLSDKNYHQTWYIYPTYDFSHCLADSIENISHSLCTLEFTDNRQIYNWIINNLNISHKPNQYEYSRLNLEYTILSKRKLKILIDKKIVKGWDDPRIPTLSGLRKRGYTPNSIINFCNKIGITKQEQTIELSLLESCIRQELNQTAYRMMAILNPIKIIIINYNDNKDELLKVPNHPQKPEFGTRTILFSRELYIDKSDFSETTHLYYKRLTINQEVRLRHSYVIKVTNVIKNENNDIDTILCTYDKNTLGKNPTDRKINGVIHWISQKNAQKAIFNIYNNLFHIKNPDHDKNFLNQINKTSLINKIGFVESNVKKHDLYSRFQFEREGYFYMESIKNNYFVFNQITTLKNNKKNTE
ncbi:MAG: glutamine--tRNA ligase [Buchnera aphidicola (Eriosoma harunire)]